MNKEKKIAEFQNATAATIKAIAANKLKNREIQFFGNTTRFNSKQITIAKDSNDFDETIVNKTRGESDEISLKLQYHDKTIHSNLKPSSDLAATIFNLAEETRIEMEPSSTSSELVFEVLISAIISHPFSPRQNVSCVKLSKTPSFSKITFPPESIIIKFPSPYPQQIPSP